MKVGRTLTFLLILTAVPVSGLFAGGVAEGIHAGIAAYQKHDFAAASKAFAAALKKEPESPEATFDLGTAEYNEGKFAEALKSFRQAGTSNAASPPLQAKASYDQGKSLAKLGDAVAAQQPQAAVGYYQKGIESFQRALQVGPTMKNAGYNIEVLRRRIKKLEQKMKQQSSNQQGKSSKRSSSKSPQQSPSGSQNPKKHPGAQSQPNTQHQQPSGAKQVNSSEQQTSGASAQSATAQQILEAEKNHRRIINLEDQQVSPHVAQDW